MFPLPSCQSLPLLTAMLSANNASHSPAAQSFGDFVLSRYWLLQLAGWGGVFLFGSAIILLVADHSATSAASGTIQMWNDVRLTLLTCLTGLLATHGLRGVIRRQRWLDLPVRTLVQRALVAWLLMTSLLGLLGATVFATPSAGEPLYASVLPCLMMNAMLLGAWLSLYFLVHVYAAWQQGNFDREQLRAANAESQMQALQAQLHPHFLFNCLNTIRSLTPAGAKSARMAVTVLADLLRACLTDGEKPTLPLARELELTRLYISMERLRFGDGLQLKEQIEPAAMSIQVPSLILLTLAENAVKHGLLQDPENNELTVWASLMSDHLSLRMISPGHLSEGRSPMPSVPSLGLGLANVQERLRLIYGPKASLPLDATEVLVTVAIRLPLSPLSLV
jgi:hypothetical protein